MVQWIDVVSYIKSNAYLQVCIPLLWESKCPRTCFVETLDSLNLMWISTGLLRVFGLNWNA